MSWTDDKELPAESRISAMDVDGSSSGGVIEVTGQLYHYNKGAAFFRFNKNGAEETCLFRPNKLYIDQQKLGASNFKSLEAISRVLAVGETLSGLVVPCQENKAYRIEELQCELQPGWYAQAVWKGEKPLEVEYSLQAGLGEGGLKQEQEVVIEDVPGRIVHNKMGSNAKGTANQTFIAFSHPETGKPDLAMFRNLRCFYMDGGRVRPEVVKLWPAGQELEVRFTGIYTPSLKELTHCGESGAGEAGMAVETRYKPNWRAKLVWIGVKPSQETLARDSADQSKVVRTRKDKTEFLETIKDCEYMCARLEKIINKTQGILMLKSRGIVFHIENLSIDGVTFTGEEKLGDHLEVGENLFAYVKPVPARVVDEYEISYEAAQIWKGKRTVFPGPDGDNKLDKKKTPIPLPSEASHHNVQVVHFTVVCWEVR